jgi:hypothetical protein
MRDYSSGETPHLTGFSGVERMALTRVHFRFAAHFEIDN